MCVANLYFAQYINLVVLPGNNTTVQFLLLERIAKQRKVAYATLTIDRFIFPRFQTSLNHSEMFILYSICFPGERLLSPFVHATVRKLARLMHIVCAFAYSITSSSRI